MLGLLHGDTGGPSLLQVPRFGHHVQVTAVEPSIDIGRILEVLEFNSLLEQKVN